ncbi:MAG TPA: S8 family peptidase [Pirellulales bacterium]|nr:S8 family peptidase [Pirellulales bacterium]
MPELPLLIFPRPQTADRDKGRGGAPDIHRPSVGRQGERIGPKLDSLQQAFEARAVEVRQSPSGIDPEQVLVIETVGSVDDFAKAVAKIDGLEWLGENEIDEIAPDDDFYDKKHKDKRLGGRLYLLMSNQQGLREMLSLWDNYKRDPSMTWQRGLTKFRDVFLLLHDIRRWDIRDRLEETGAIEAWQEDLRDRPDQPVKLEIELWFRGNLPQREAAEAAVAQLIQQSGGSVPGRYVLQEIAYHGILAELPQGEIERIINHQAVELVKCDSIMFFRPVGQMATGKQEIEGDPEDLPERDEKPLPSGAPVIAVLDGFPLEKHELLDGRLIVDDPDDFAPDCPAARRVHGTSICSLVVHGDLSDGNRALSRPVYVRPIMKPVSWHHEPWPEELPRDMLVIDLIHRAVRRICEGDGNQPAVAPAVRIINLAIGDPSRPFFQLMSSLARLLDWLSHKYGVLFVVSAGNQTHDLDLGISESEFRALGDAEREALAIRKLYEDARNRRLFSPAESINAITVGATHHDGSGANPVGRLVELFTVPLPSPISAFGGGYRRSVKPDLTFSGGRVLYNYSPTGTTLSCFPRRSAPGQCSATPGSLPGDIRKTFHSAGTSNAAALLSHHLGRCHDSLATLLESQQEVPDATAFIAPLLKAMIVHGCSWDMCGDRLHDVLSPHTDGRSLRHWKSQWLGYGVPDTQRVMQCAEQRATVLGFGELGDGAAHVFELPLPPSLGSRTDWRRLTVTVAWLSPVLPTTQKYRAASLWFDVQGPRLTRDRTDAEWHEVRRGTVHHEVFEGRDAHVISDGDSLSIKVNCRADAGALAHPVPYGLVVSLEVSEGVAIPVYQEVRARIRPTIEVRTRNPLGS